jgi:hypothetical protein
MYQDELIACGALVRVGRKLVIIGAGYAVWLQKGAARVKNYEIAPNRTTESAADRAA